MDTVLEIKNNSSHFDDHILLSFEERFRRRVVLKTDKGYEFFLALEKAAELPVGGIFLLQSGKKIKIEARKVTLHEFDFTQINLPQLNFHVRCSKGTYIRSLAHDFGKSLQSGGYLSHLRRTAIGSYRLYDAFTPDQILKQLEVL